MRASFKCLTMSATLLAMASAPLRSTDADAAATLNVVPRLLGASNVDVGGVLYDVMFVGGTCASVYSGCDELSDFPFADPTAASQALLDQVLLDGELGAFDSNPALTNGCPFDLCEVLTPWFFDPSDDALVFLSKAQNEGPTTGFDYVGSVEFSAAFFDTAGTQFVFAVWTPVPEPSTALLLTAGLIALGGRRRPARAA
jgi:hypothetical protein